MTRNEGIVYKRLKKNGKNLTLQSDNSASIPYEVKASEVLEIWEYACSIAAEGFHPEDMGVENVKDMLRKVSRDILDMKKGK